MIRGLIFDFDGLILETESADFLTWQECFEQHGCELSFDLWGDLIGRASGGWDVYGHLESLAGRAIDRDALRVARRQRYLELVEAEVLRPGVEAYLREAGARGWRLGVASSATRDWVEGHLARLGIRQHFETVRCREDVEHAKPAPDLYLAALRDLRLAPHQAIALEDSPNGARAAKAAGLFCVVVPNPLTARLSLDHADHIVASLADLPLDRLIEFAGRARSSEQAR